MCPSRKLALALLLAAGLAPAAGRAEPPAAAPARAARSPWDVSWRLAAAAGGFSGQGTRTDSGGLLVAEAEVEPSLALGDVRLALPLRLARRQTVGADLSETTAAAALAPEWRVGRDVRLGAEAGYHGTFRLDWPDQYQRTATGYLPPTDRYSYRSFHGGASAWLQPARHHHLRLRYRLTSTDFTRDPNFDPLAEAHLTPRDNLQHRLSASWRYVRAAWAVGLRVDAKLRRDSVYPARDAVTGSTAGNPDQRLNDYEPSAELELRNLWDVLEVSLEYGLPIRDDTFEGYYSYTGHHPRLAVEWRATERLEVGVSVQAWLLTYGPSSRSPSSTEDGARLHDRSAEVEGRVRWRLSEGLALFGEGHWRRRDTNYPDYVPGVLPATRLYDVAWDYDELRAVTGVEWRR